MKRVFFVCGSVFLLIFAPLAVRADELFLGPESFVPLHSSTLYDINASEYGIQMASGSPTYIFSAPIHLPQGAKITGYTVFYMDNSTSSMWFRMIRVVQYTGGWNEIFPYWYTAEETTTRQIVKKTDVNWTYSEIRNEACTYNFYVSFQSAEEGANLRFYGVKIFYKMP